MAAAALALLALIVAAACSSPAGPTPPPTSAPAISCPLDVAVESKDGNAVAVNYTVPTAIGGAAPVSVACLPPPGTAFPIGALSVNCTATDSLGRTGTCGFSVKVSTPPRLKLTKFMAFGDSLTEGKPSRVYAFDDFPGSYPTDLYTSLAAAYPSQTVTMSKQGKGGEATADGRARLQTLLAAEHPEVLLLMEGANDLSTGDPSVIPSALRNMDEMVTSAKGAGAFVFLAMIPPQVKGRPLGGGWNIVPTYNEGIRALAGKYDVALVDVYSALNTDLSAYFGADGLHCTTAGYQKMADTFHAAIKLRLEVPGVTPSAFIGRLPASPAEALPTSSGQASPHPRARPSPPRR